MFQVYVWPKKTNKELGHWIVENNYSSKWNVWSSDGDFIAFQSYENGTLHGSQGFLFKGNWHETTMNRGSQQGLQKIFSYPDMTLRHVCKSEIGKNDIVIYNKVKNIDRRAEFGIKIK